MSPGFFDALRSSQTVATRVDLWRNGLEVASDIPFSAGNVTVSAGTGVRRTLDLTVTDVSLWDTLVVPGTELRPWRGVEYPNRATELAPLGVFSVGRPSMRVGVADGISISSAPDRWARVQRARFVHPVPSITGAFAREEARRLMSGAVPEAAYEVTATSTATVGALVWDRDRDKAVEDDLLPPAAAEGYFTATGDILVRDAPLLSADPVWTVDVDQETGVLLGGNRVRDDSRTYNVVVVRPAAIDGTVPFAPQVVADTDPTSPTYAGAALERAVPYFYSSPVIKTAAQALAAGQTILNRVKSFNAQVDLTAAVNPALEPGDVILVRFLDHGGVAVVERHLVEALTIPLTLAEQQITTRSSRPEGDVPAEE
jgi:hypothetical protein